MSSEIALHATALADAGGVLGAVRRHQPQFAQEPDGLNRHIRAIGPVTEVFCQGLFAAIDDNADCHNRHWFSNVLLSFIFSHHLSLTFESTVDYRSFDVATAQVRKH